MTAGLVVFAVYTIHLIGVGLMMLMRFAVELSMPLAAKIRVRARRRLATLNGDANG